MQTDCKVAMLGGDKRMAVAAMCLRAQGFDVTEWGMGAGETGDWRAVLVGAKAVILPLPASADGVRIRTPSDPQAALRFSSLLCELKPHVPILGGRIPPIWADQAAASGFLLEDYYALETLQIKNALPTAEGAICLALDALPVTLSGTEVAVIGYGRIASLLAEKLQALQAKVTVFARKPKDLAHAEARGLCAVKLQGEGAASSLMQISPSCRMIFNTVPQRILSQPVLARLPRTCMLMELASLPGGFDPAIASALGLTVIPGAALPGKCFPESAGEILGSVLSARLQELLETRSDRKEEQSC